MMPFVRAFGILLVALGSTGASAHDFWLQPDQWRVEGGKSLGVSLLVGHSRDRQASPIPASRITRFDAIDANGQRTSLLGSLQSRGARAPASIDLPEPGIYVLALESDDKAESHLPADRFNDYLVTEGLTPAIEIRSKTGRTDAAGSENYSRAAKTIVQSGDGPGHWPAAALMPVGLSLEIVPDAGHDAIRSTSDFPVRIYFLGQPLAGALVKLTDLSSDSRPVATARSDGQGRASFPRPGRGSWMFNVVWTRQQDAGRLTDFETYFSSLSFGVAN